MKLDIYNIGHHHNSPHESTSIMNGKHHYPLVEAADGKEDEEQNQLMIIPQNSTLSSQTPQSLPFMPDVYYSHQQSSTARPELSPELPPYSIHHQQQHGQHQHPQQRQHLPSSYYGQQTSPVYAQMHHHAHQAHPHGPYFPNNSWSGHPSPPGSMAPPPPMMPSMGSMAYYAHQPPHIPSLGRGVGGTSHTHAVNMHHAGNIMPINTTAYQTLDSRGSHSSYSSSDTFGNNSAGRRGGGRRNNNRRGGSRQGGGGGGGGNPPNRGWYRFDETTTLYQMKGRIVEIAKDRDGSKFIQRRLQIAEPPELVIVYDESMAAISELWNDVYGNYILQGLLELGTQEMRDGIGQKILGEGDVVFLSMKVYGCRLIQKALETLSEEDVANIVAAIKGKVWLLVHDHNGNHVIQKSITKINEFFLASEKEEEDNEASMTLLKNSLNIIIEEVTSCIKDLAIHPYGCRVVQRLIEHCSGESKGDVLDSILVGGLHGTLINHEYGNYVIQRVLTYGRPSDKAAVFETITASSNILKLSKQKHSSNVVEMMLTYGNQLQRQRIIEEILNCFCVDQNYVSKSAAVSMAEDNYANYVLKTALDILEESNPQRERLFEVLLSSLEELESSPFAKQVVLRVKAYAQDSTS